MAGTEPTTQAVVDNVARLLKTGEFSDLTLVCQESRFLVHKAIVCTRSPVWSAAVSNGFQETTTNLIEVQVADAPTLQRALTYLYTGEYDDGGLSTTSDCDERDIEVRFMPAPSPPGHVTADRTEGDSEPSTEETEALVAGDLHSSASVSVPQGLLEPSQGAAQGSAEASSESKPHNDCCTMQMNGSDPICANTRLCANVLVYILADYCQILDLRRVAATRFTDLLHEVCNQGFGDVCALVYRDAPSTAESLRSSLADAIARHGPQLVDDRSFSDMALANPEVLQDAFSRVVWLHKATSERLDAATAEFLSAMEIANEANKTAREATDRLIAQVNKAERCRHCGLENNVYFELETSGLGSHSHSFRCRCRTRY